MLFIFHCSLIQIAFVRFVHVGGWTSVCRKYWFEGYHPKPQGGTNNVLQNFIWALVVGVNIVHSARYFGLPEGIFLPTGLFQDFDYFPLKSLNWCLVTRGVQFQMSWSTLNPSLFIVTKALSRPSSNTFLALWYHLHLISVSFTATGR